MFDVVYFSNVSENTKRFVDKLGIPNHRIPLYPTDEHLQVSKPFVLFTPTYGLGDDDTSVPKQVIRFLNDPVNRQHLRGVVGAGNTNFGDKFCRASEVIARKTGAPLIYKFEVLGTQYDVSTVKEKMELLWKQQ